MKNINLTEFEINFITESLKNYTKLVQNDLVKTSAPKDFVLSRIDNLIQRIDSADKLK
jgi:hypothetical protein